MKRRNLSWICREKVTRTYDKSKGRHRLRQKNRAVFHIVLKTLWKSIGRLWRKQEKLLKIKEISCLKNLWRNGVKAVDNLSSRC